MNMIDQNDKVVFKSTAVITILNLAYALLNMANGMEAPRRYVSARLQQRQTATTLVGPLFPRHGICLDDVDSHRPCFLGTYSTYRRFLNRSKGRKLVF